MHEEGSRDSSRAAGWHAMAPQRHRRQRGSDLLLLGVNPPGAMWLSRGEQSVEKPRGTRACSQRPERAASLHPTSPLRQVWGSAPRRPGTAGYARNAPNASGLDCGCSGRRAAAESLGGLAAARCSPWTGDEAEQWQPRSPKASPNPNPRGKRPSSLLQEERGVGDAPRPHGAAVGVVLAERCATSCPQHPGVLQG